MNYNELKASIEAGIAQQNNFTRSELLGRGLFESFLKQKNITNYKFTEGQFDKVDCFIQAQKKWAVEIKVRDESADQYKELFFELQKLKAMCSIIKAGEAEEGLYINFIGSKLYVFNIRKIVEGLQKKQLRVKNHYCNRTTAIASGKVDKSMIEVPKKLAEEYEFIEGKWAKVRP